MDEELVVDGETETEETTPSYTGGSYYTWPWALVKVTKYVSIAAAFTAWQYYQAKIAESQSKKD